MKISFNLNATVFLSDICRLVFKNSILVEEVILIPLLTFQVSANSLLRMTCLMSFNFKGRKPMFDAHSETFQSMWHYGILITFGTSNDSK